MLDACKPISNRLRFRKGRNLRKNWGRDGSEGQSASLESRVGPDLSTFETILLDMNGTFVFGHDRFGPDEDYHRTYRLLGGTCLSADSVRLLVDHVCASLGEKYHSAEWQDQFPGVRGELERIGGRIGFEPHDLSLIEDVIALHERGDIPFPYRKVIHALRQTHRLAVVSNIWSRKYLWLELFEARGVSGCFDTLVFSSDGPTIKPAPDLFNQATGQLNCAPERTLFIGDDPFRDIQGARSVGMKTVLVGPADPGPAVPDWKLPSLLSLVPGSV